MLPRVLVTNPTHPLRQVYARLLWLALAVFILWIFLAVIPFRIERESRGVVGLNMNWNRAGEMVLAPIPGLPAAEAGIETGNVLLAVNRVSVTKASWEAGVRPLLRGRPNSTVILTVRDLEGKVRQYALIYSSAAPLPLGLSVQAYGQYLALLDVLLILIYILIGALIIWLRTSDEFAIMLAYALLLIPGRISPAYDLLRLNRPEWTWAVQSLGVLGATLIPLSFALFPNGRFVPRWIWLYPLAGLLYASATLFFGWFPGPISDTLTLLVDAIVVGIGVLAQVYRYRRVATPSERQQTKWVIYGMAIGFAGYYGFNFPRAIFPALQFPTLALSLYNLIALPLFYLALFMVPLTIAISILKYRLWDIDLLIRRTLVYSVVTATLALVYFGSVVLLQQAFRLIIGQTSSLAIVTSTLMIAALFAPFRNQIQTFIDQRFYRRKYNAELALAAFSVVARDEVDLDRLSAELLRVVDVTIQPERMHLWLRKDD